MGNGTPELEVGGLASLSTDSSTPWSKWRAPARIGDSPTWLAVAGRDGHLRQAVTRTANDPRPIVQGSVTTEWPPARIRDSPTGLTIARRDGHLRQAVSRTANDLRVPASHGPVSNDDQKRREHLRTL